MKNLHLIPTNKPSRLYKDDFGKLIYSINIDQEQKHFEPQNIYITNDEEIKEGDWVLVNGFILRQVDYIDGYMVIDTTGGKHHNSVCKKIILTTDQSLDGVQSIDDEFLQWFVKNPSCEKVQVDKFISGRYFVTNPIITKEPKQETLEEVAERLYPTTIDSFTDNGFDLSERERLIFINGAKWQQEQYVDFSNPNADKITTASTTSAKIQTKRLYSEEEVIELLNKREDYINQTSSIFDYISAKEWFNQFKNK